MAANLNYQNLMAEIAKLQEQANNLRNSEVGMVIENIKKMMADYNLSPKDIGFKISKGAVKKGKSVKVSAKYKDPVSGQTWSGRGRNPKWLQQAISEGKNREDFIIQV